MNTAFLCTGQGSQYVGMLKDLVDKYANIADLVNECDEILGYPLSNICFEGPIDRLKETRYTQPALFIHSAVLYSLIKNHIQVDEHCYLFQIINDLSNKEFMNPKDVIIK